MVPTMLSYSLRQLQYALAVAETRNFRRAAEQCAVAQPSLSSQVAALEEALGAKLFERDRRRGVLLTPAGEALLPRIRGLLLEATELVKDARQFRDPLAGSLRLGIIPTMAPYLLPSVVPLLQEALPKLSVRWIEDRTASLVARLQQGLLDGALLALEADLEGLETAALWHDPFLVALPRGHRLGKARHGLRMSELEGERILLLDDGHCLRDQALAACQDAGVQELGFRATSLPTLVQMVSSGQGITLLPRLSLETEAGRAPLVIRPFAEPAPFRTLALAWRRTSHALPVLRKLVRLLRNMNHSTPEL